MPTKTFEDKPMTSSGSLTVAVRSPNSDQKNPTEMYLIIESEDVDLSAYYRFKGIESLDRIIKALIDNRCKVWPDAPEIVELPGTDSNLFLVAFKAMASRIHNSAERKGVWLADRDDGEMITLMHLALDDALEAARRGNQPEYEKKLADCIFRIMDASAGKNLRVGEAILTITEYDEGARPYKPGNEFP